MTNKDFMAKYIKEETVGACNHLMALGNELVNYSTTICTIDREHKVAKVNTKKYSRTTSKIQSTLLGLLEAAGYTVEEYEGKPAWDGWGRGLWNAGYMGAPCWTTAEAKERYERSK